MPIFGIGREGTDFDPLLTFVNSKTGLPYGLPGVYVVNLYRSGAVTPWVSGTLANTKLASVINSPSTIKLNFPASDITLVGGTYITVEIIRTDAGTDFVTSFLVRMLSPGEALGSVVDGNIVMQIGDITLSISQPDAIFYQLGIGTVSTSASSVPASASISGTGAVKTLNLSIPQGIQGIQGVAGLVKNLYPAAQTNVPRGAMGIGAITAGSGGANGTFALAFTGGNFGTNPTGTFTVAGGLLTAVTLTGPGLYVGAAPTAPTPSFAASAGLTGAACPLVVDFLLGGGEFYWTDHLTDANLLALYYRSGTSAVATSPLITFSRSAFAELLTRQTIGVNPPLNGTGTAGVNVTISNRTACTVAGNVVEYGFYGSTAGVGTFVVETLNGDGTLTKTFSEPMEYVAGPNVFYSVAPIAIGQLIGIYSRTSMLRYDGAINDGYYATTGLVDVSSAKTNNTTLQMQMYAICEADTRAKATIAARAATTQGTTLGYAALRGAATPAATGVLAGNSGTYIFAGVQSIAETITDVSFVIDVADTGNIVISTLTVAGNVKTDIYTSPAITFSAGLNTITGLNITKPAGAVIGIKTLAGRMWLVLGGKSYFSAVATPGAWSDLGYSLQANYTAKTGLVAQVKPTSDIALSITGIDVSGASDVTTAFNAAYAACALGAPVYVPPGIYNITSLVRAGIGLYGPGEVNVNGHAFVLPEAPMYGTIFDGARSALAGYIDNGTIILAGESDLGISGSSQTKEFADLFAKALNIGAETSASPVVIFLGPYSSRPGASFYGLTPTGTITFVDTGPMPGSAALSAVLAAGAKYSFTGVLSRIGVFYDQAAGGGTLTIGVQGGATLASVSTANASPLLSRYLGVDTGSTVSQTYEITCTVANSIVIGIERRGLVAAITSGVQRAPKRIPVINASRGSNTIVDWGTAERASAIEMAKFGTERTGRPLVFMRQGASDAVGGASTATLQTMLETAIDAWVASGADVALIIYSRQGNLNNGASPSYPNGHESFVAAHRKAAKSRNVPLIDWSRLPLFNAGLFADQAHPNDAGIRMLVNETLFQIANWK